jgi:5-hydroxyisourate hydrolase
VYTLLPEHQPGANPDLRATRSARRDAGSAGRRTQAKECIPMGHLSTHVLDTMNGCPAAGMAVKLLRLDGASGVQTLKSFELNHDGRADGPLLDAQSMAAGRYRLLFSVAPYFRGRGVALPEPPFIDEVQLDFGIADAAGHYHVPLLVSPWAYSTYRGS